MRILVTGGAGFIGGHLVQRLARERLGEVVVLDNMRRGQLGNLGDWLDRVALVRADIRDRRALREAMRGIDLVFHLAAQSNVMGAVQDLKYSFATNVAGTFNVLEAAQEMGVRRVVFTSSREVYGDPHELPVPETAPLRPKNAYGASKVAGELYCRVFGGDGMETVVLRLANVYGPRDQERVVPIFVERALSGQDLTVYGGNQILDFVWIDVVVEALLRAGLGDFIDEPVNIGSGRGMSIKDLAARIVRSTNSRSAIRVVGRRCVEVDRFVADVGRAASLFQLEEPSDPLFGLPKVVAWMRSGLYTLAAPALAEVPTDGRIRYAESLRPQAA